jgi:uncharacterized protein YcbK (DUF882 family)
MPRPKKLENRTRSTDTPENADRRRLLRRAAAGVPGMLLLAPALSPAAARPARSLSFVHTHTGERCSVVFHENGRYLDDGLAELNRFLRDFRTEEVHPIDPTLFDTLHALRVLTGSRGRFEVISGYRSPKTNAMLRKASKGVAKKSLHMQGRAIDVSLTDLAVKDLHKAALKLRRGGVGYYGKSGFVHLDTGRVRSW